MTNRPAPLSVASACLLGVAALLSSPATYAEVYKCTEPDGRKVYQDLPCKAHQQGATFDPASTNMTTIDSEASRREAQGALVTREASRPQRAPEPEATHDDGYEPYDLPIYPPEPVYYPYPVYPARDHHHHHHDDRPHIPQRPDPTPMSRPPRGGGGYVPPPPTIREVAPRPPATTARTGRPPERDRR